MLANIQWAGAERMGQSCFQRCPATGRGANGALEVPYKYEEKLSYFEGDRALKRAARQVMESPSLAIFKHIGEFSSTNYPREPALAGMISRSLFQAQQFY